MECRLIVSLVFVITTLASFAQKDVTTFLGIPVDGTKTEMKQKLIAKGFVPKKEMDDEHLEGEFNGKDVRVYIVTNNNKVYRLMVGDAYPMDEPDIKVRFNKLVRQFKNNQRYVSLGDQTIPDDEDISYEMTVKNKRYEAAFFQVPDPQKMDSVSLQKQIRTYLLNKYTEEQLQNPPDEIYNYIQSAAINFTADMFRKKLVWFRISKSVVSYGQYQIMMYYDNEYNKSNGEDL